MFTALLMLAVIILGFLFYRRGVAIRACTESLARKSENLKAIKEVLEQLSDNDVTVARKLYERFHDDMNYFDYIGTRNENAESSNAFVKRLTREYAGRL